MFNKTEQHEYGGFAQQQQGRGGASTRTAESGMRVTPVETETGLYMEQQLAKFCQIHALNALLGRTAVQPKDMLNFCKEHQKKNTGLGNALKGRDTWCPSQSNFNDAFLHYHGTPAVRLCSLADDIPIGSDASRFINGLPTEHSAFILSWYLNSKSPGFSKDSIGSTAVSPPRSGKSASAKALLGRVNWIPISDGGGGFFNKLQLSHHCW
ncbi:hypothetical protein WJX77_011984 [Trebouxia sp. C0004]